MDKKEDFSAAAWREVRKPIAHANRTNPDDPVPLYAYFRSFQQQGITPPEIAIKGLEQAFSLAPEDVQLRMEYAYSLANKGEFAPAIKLAQSVAFDPHGGGGEQLLEHLEAMRDRREGAAADTAVEAEEPADSD